MFDIEKSKAICEAARSELVSNVIAAFALIQEQRAEIEAKDREIERLTALAEAAYREGMLTGYAAGCEGLPPSQVGRWTTSEACKALGGKE